MGIEPTGVWDDVAEVERDPVTIGSVVPANTRTQAGFGAGTHTVSHGRLSTLHLNLMRQIQHFGNIDMGGPPVPGLPESSPYYRESAADGQASPRDMLLEDIRRGRRLRVVNWSRRRYTESRTRAASQPNPAPYTRVRNSFLEEIRLGRNRVLERLVNNERESSGSLYPPFFAG